MAYMQAERTPVADTHEGIYPHFIVVPGYRRTADSKAVVAPVAFFQIHHQWFAFFLDSEGAVSADNYDRGFICLYTSPYGGFDRGQVEGAYDIHIPDADSPGEVFYYYSSCLFTSG
jgi:hypothetical protein